MGIIYTLFTLWIYGMMLLAGLYVLVAIINLFHDANEGTTPTTVKDVLYGLRIYAICVVTAIAAMGMCFAIAYIFVM